MILGILFGIAVAFMAAPIALSYVPGLSVGFVVTVVMEAVGIVVLLITAYLAAYRKFFVIAEANQAVIRTGGIGKSATAKPTVAIGRGIWVIPMIHKMQMLRFEQYVLTVQRRRELALLCEDCLLADVSITFKISIPQQEEEVLKYLAAAGTRNLNDKSTIEVLCGDSLETALRDAATGRSYQDLFDGREEVGKAIEDSLSNDLPKIGLQLSSAKLTDVQPTDLEFYDQNNPQHAVGLTKIVHITQDQNLKTKQKQLSTSEAIRFEEVETKKKILNLDQDEAFAQSNQEKEIAIRRATDKRTAQEADIAQDEAIRKRQIEMDKIVAVEQARQEQTTAEAEVAKEKAVEQAQIEKVKEIQKARKDQEIELVEKEKEKQIAEEAQRIALVAKAKEREAAERDKEITLTLKEAEKAEAEKSRQEAEAAAEEARQNVLGIQTIESAERQKRQSIIEQEAASEMEMIEKQKAADAAAYSKQREADAEAYSIQKNAEARQTAAEADYEAKVKAAKAEQEAAEARAAGSRAGAMVPVEVKKAEVAVENERVAVLERELAAKSEHEDAALNFEIKKLEISKSAEVRIAMANAVSQLTSNVQANIYGDADTLRSVTEGMSKAFGISAFMKGVDAELPVEIKGMLAGGVQNLVEGISTALSNLGKSPDAKDIEDAVKKAIADSHGKGTD